MPTKTNSKGRLMAADFFTYTFKAFLIGIGTSLVLGGAVILLVQSSSPEDAALGTDTPAIEVAK